MSQKKLTRAVATFASGNSQTQREQRFAELEGNYWARKERDNIGWQRFLPADKTARVVDLGCGPAAVLHDLWKSYGPKLKLIGVDSAKDYLALAKTKAADLDVPIEFLELAASDLTPAALGGPVDLIYVAHAVFEFGPLATTVRRLSSCLASGGWLVFVETDLPSWRISPSDGEWLPRIEHMVSTYEKRTGNRLDPREIPPALAAAGLSAIEWRPVGSSALLAAQPSFFHSFEVFYPQNEQDEAFAYIRRITEESAGIHRYGFKQHAVIAAQKP